MDKMNIRPKARIIKTIGEDLIKDPYAAVVELVKNSYDADSQKVNITIEKTKDEQFGECLKFTIEDYGEGMPLPVVEKAWMTPATSHKIDKQFSSSKKRALQGQKGIGRYAATVLGDILQMTTTDLNGFTTKITIDWSMFNGINYLDEITIPYEHTKTNLQSGTKLEIYSKIDRENIENMKGWSKKDKDALLKELRKLLSPIYKDNDEDKFEIFVKYRGLEEYGIEDSEEQIEAFPLADFYDYRINGKVDSNGKCVLRYENQNSKERKDILLEIENHCGELEVDFRVFDLDIEAIDNLIHRGLKNSGNGEYLTRKEAKNLIGRYVGIGIYRNLFRIRPYGDSQYDWLDLNQRRVNNPTMCLSLNQIVGHIGIQSEKESGLIEKSSREGLKEDSHYENLRTILEYILAVLENERYIFRKATRRGRKPAKNIKESLHNLFSLDKLSSNINTILEKSDVDPSVIKNIKSALQDETYSKNEMLKKIEDTIMMYEAHITLGKLVFLVLHEGRKYLQTIGSKLTNIQKNIGYLTKCLEHKTQEMQEIEDDIIKYSDDSRTQLNEFSKLFKKLEPLMHKSGARKRDLNLYQNALSVAGFFETSLKEKHIDIKVVCENQHISLKGSEEDFFIIYSNLIENSMYWFDAIKKEVGGVISIDIYQEDDKICIDYKDNGIGIKEKNLEFVFDPGFSTKPEGGTGIGMTLVGQAVNRNDGNIKCIQSDEGAYFKMTFRSDKNG